MFKYEPEHDKANNDSCVERIPEVSFLCFFLVDPCGEGTKYMIEDSWIPDSSDPCRRCTCEFNPEDPTGMKGVVRCDPNACTNEETGKLFFFFFCPVDYD